MMANRCSLRKHFREAIRARYLQLQRFGSILGVWTQVQVGRERRVGGGAARGPAHVSAGLSGGAPRGPAHVSAGSGLR